MQLKCSQTQTRSKDIGKTLHVPSVAQLKLCHATRILFVGKENKSNNFVQQFFSPNLPSSSILESTTTHVWRMRFPRM